MKLEDSQSYFVTSVNQCFDTKEQNKWTTISKLFGVSTELKRIK